MSDTPVAIPERGEVIVELNDAPHVVSLSMEKARVLDLSLPTAGKHGGGILGMLALNLTEYPYKACEQILKAAFETKGRPLTDAEFSTLVDEYGLYELSDLSAQLLRPVVLGKKKMRAIQAAADAAAAEKMTMNSPGDTGSAPQ